MSPNRPGSDLGSVLPDRVLLDAMRVAVVATDLSGTVFYCNGAWRSALATDVAKQMGLEPVFEMDGGFTAWKNAGYPVADRAKKTPA